MATSLSASALRPELWRKQLFADARDDIYMTRFMGKTEKSMIQELEDLKKEERLEHLFRARHEALRFRRDRRQ